MAALVAAGDSLEQVALKLRITVNTARDHLKVIFSKTGTTRQAQLAALLNRSVAMLDGPQERLG